jgi:hypothetical protein
MGQADDDCLPAGAQGRSAPAARATARGAASMDRVSRDANCLYYGMGESTIARIDAGECMRNMTEARARELEGLGHQ